MDPFIPQLTAASFVAPAAGEVGHLYEEVIRVLGNTNHMAIFLNFLHIFVFFYIFSCRSATCNWTPLDYEHNFQQFSAFTGKFSNNPKIMLGTP